MEERMSRQGGILAAFFGFLYLRYRNRVRFLGPTGIGLATATGPDRAPVVRDAEPAPPDPAAPELPEHRMIDVTRAKVV
jgi:hypothetical protein